MTGVVSQRRWPVAERLREWLVAKCMGLKAGGTRGSLRNVSVGASAILDSEINQWKFDEGSGTTAADAIGSNDLTLDSPLWTTQSDATGGYVLTFDGTDDFAEGSTMSGIEQGTDYSVGITINADSLANQEAILAQSTNGGNQRFAIGIDDSANEVFAQRWDNGTYLDSARLNGTSETNRFRLFVSWDSAAQSFTLFKNGSQSSTGGDTIGNLIGGAVTFRIGSATSGSNYYGGEVDNPILYNVAGGSSLAADDYNLQPWS